MTFEISVRLALRRLRAVTLVLVLAFVGCGGDEARDAVGGASAGRDSTAKRPVTVAAASDLKFALDEIVAAFERREPAIDVMVSYGSSGNFSSQLSNRAPFDLFLSADIEYPRRLASSGHAVDTTLFGYAVGQLVVWVPSSSALDVESRGIAVLTDPSVRKIAIANPEHAPYGRAAEAAMKSLGVYDAVKSRLVLGENIAQTAQFVESGAADAGILALSLAMAPSMRDRGRYWLIPLDAYPRLEQGGVILAWAADRPAVDALVAFLRGEEARGVLRSYGFIMPGE